LQIPSFSDVDALFSFFHISSSNYVPLMVLICVKGPKRKQFFSVNAVETTIGRGAQNTIW
jgi:hypothetical protein